MATRHALIIGNSHYADTTLARLSAPEADVRGLAALLEDPTIGGFTSVQALIDAPEAITRRAMAAFFARALPDDLLLVYFSGHGVLDPNGRLYLASVDTQHDLPQGTAIPTGFITDSMDSSRSRRQVLILDCCHSGAFARGTRSGTETKALTAATFEGIGFGRVVLTATDATQYAWEGDVLHGGAENSVFTRHLIDGLRTGAADADGDGDITLEELYDYVYAKVVQQTPRQTPRKWSYNQEGALVLARNPRPATPKPADLPAELLLSVADPRAWVREGAVAELGRLLIGSHFGLALAAREALERLATDDSRRVSEAATATLVAQRLARDGSGARTTVAAGPEAPPASVISATEGADSGTRGPAGDTVRQPALTKEQVAHPDTRLADHRGPAWLRAALTHPRFAERALPVGWGLALFLAAIVYWSIYLTVGDEAPTRLPAALTAGLVGAGATWLAFKARLGSRAPSAWLVTGTVMACSLSEIWLTPALMDVYGYYEGLAAGAAVVGILTGAALAALLVRTHCLRAPNGGLIIAVACTIGWCLAAWLGFEIYRLFGNDPVSGMRDLWTNLGFTYESAVPLAVLVDAVINGGKGALAVGIGSWALFRQLPSTSTAAEPVAAPIARPDAPR